MTTPILRVLFWTIALASVSAALAKPADATRPSLLQQRIVIAEAQTRTWESASFGGILSLSVYDDHARFMTFHWVSQCRGYWKRPGVFIAARLRNCPSASEAPSAVIFRYRAKQPQRFLFMIHRLRR